MAGDCPLPGLDERQLTRNLRLKLDESAAIGDPKPSPLSFSRAFITLLTFIFLEKVSYSK